MSIEAPVPSNNRIAPSEISTGSLNVNVTCVGCRVEHLARLRVARQQLGVCRHPADADERRQRQAGRAGDMQLVAAGSWLDCDRFGHFRLRRWSSAPRPATSSDPTTAAAERQRDA